MRVSCFWLMVGAFYATFVWCKLVPFWLVSAGYSIPESLKVFFR